MPSALKPLAMTVPLRGRFGGTDKHPQCGHVINNTREVWGGRVAGRGAGRGVAAGTAVAVATLPDAVAVAVAEAAAAEIASRSS